MHFNALMHGCCKMLTSKVHPKQKEGAHYDKILPGLYRSSVQPFSGQVNNTLAASYLNRFGLALTHIPFVCHKYASPALSVLFSIASLRLVWISSAFSELPVHLVSHSSFYPSAMVDPF